MMKTGILFLSLMLLSFGCDNNGDLPKDGNAINNVNIPPLNGTKWKLAGIADVETNTLTELEPQECKKCYTITFDTDTTASGYTACNEIYITLNIDSIQIVGTKMYCGDTTYYVAIRSVTSYIVMDGELKFFYNNGKNYLLYKPINDEEDNYTPINITLHDQPIDTILHYIQGKWQVVYGKGGFMANMIHHYDNYFMEFTSDGKYISNRDNYTYTATIRWDRVHSLPYSVTDSSWLMVVNPYPSLLMDEIKNDTLIYHEYYVSELLFDYCVKIK